jgi:hypothetical protein
VNESPSSVFPLPPESSGWSFEDFQRFASISVIAEMWLADERAFLGAEAKPMSYEKAEALYERLRGAADRIKVAQAVDSVLRPAWEAAINACLQGHDHCTFGGPAPKSGYWLADDACVLDHGETCAWCLEPTATVFAGRAGDSIWHVPACQPHADAWVVVCPDWHEYGRPQ